MNQPDPESLSYYKYTTKARLDKAINTLLGILEGIAIDRVINVSEVDYLGQWLLQYREYMHLHPFNELLPVVSEVILDGIIDEDEYRDIVWLCKRLASDKYYNMVTVDMQRLHSILGGIAADGIIKKAEAEGLRDWLNEHSHLHQCWPYDQVAELVEDALMDGRIDPQENANLLKYFNEFADFSRKTHRNIDNAYTLQHVCAKSPVIVLAERTFCFTGMFATKTRPEVMAIVKEHGGRVVKSVSRRVHYLVIGTAGNPCWAYARYGRKVEKAIELKRTGANILLVREPDFVKYL